MKKNTLINKFEAKLDASLEALYAARDLIEDLGEIDTYELNEAVEEIEEKIAELSENTKEEIEDLIF